MISRLKVDDFPLQVNDLLIEVDCLLHLGIVFNLQIALAFGTLGAIAFYICQILKGIYIPIVKYGLSKVAD